MNVKKPPVASMSATSYDKRHLRRTGEKDVEEISPKGNEKCKWAVKDRRGCKLGSKVR